MTPTNLSLKKPKSLKFLLHAQLTNLILAKSTTFWKGFRRVSISYHGLQHLRNCFQVLPVSVRFQLFRHALTWINRNDEESEICFIFTGVLVDSDMDCIDYVNIDSSLHPVVPFSGDHVKTFFEFLASKMKKLKVLVLPYTEDLIERTIFCNKSSEFPPCLRNLIVNNSCIVRLELPGLLSDIAFKVIANSCYHLQILNACESKEVTDHGICNLTQVLECESKGGKLDAKSMEFYPSLLDKAWNNCNGSNKEIICTYSVRKSKLCRSLRILRLYNTCVTHTGITTLLALIDNLEDVGMTLDSFLDHVLESYQERQQTDDEFELPHWNLHSIDLNIMTTKRLKVLNLLRTKPITHLKILDMKVSTNKFNNYISVSCTLLTHLLLQCTPHTPVFKISLFLKYCPNLDTFCIKGKKLGMSKLEKNRLVNIELPQGPLLWGDDDQAVPIPTLKYVNFTGSVSAKIFQLLLESATRLQEAHFGGIIGGNELLLSLCQSSISKELTKLMIYPWNKLDNAQHLSMFWLKNQNLKDIGFVDYKIEDLGLSENVHLTLHSSPCMRYNHQW